MTKVLHVADLHLGLFRFGTGIDDQAAMLDRIAVAAEQHEVDVIVLAGDTWHTRRPASPEILIFVRFLKRVTQFAEVLITAGNHDGPGEIEEVYPKPVGWLEAVEMTGVHAVPDDRIVTVAGTDFRVLPYVHRRSRQAAHVDRLVSEPGKRAGSRPLVFVGHLTVADSMLTAQRIMQIGWDLTVGRESFETYDAAMLGHIHHAQELPGGQTPVAYSGSPERYDFGEEEQAKGGRVWDIGGTVRSQPVDLGARVLQTVHLSTPVEFGWQEAITPGSVLRVIATGQSDSWSALTRDLRAQALEAGASWVRVEQRQVGIVRTRAEIDPHVDVLDALKTWCDVTGEDFESLQKPAADLVGA